MDYSAKIYGIYLRHVSKEDIHVYSVDECFIDDKLSAALSSHCKKEMAVKAYAGGHGEETGVTATAGVGTNLYLAKIAMGDIVSKACGMTILESWIEFSYREQLWDHNH